jgi:hypothetical protein
MLRDGRGDEKEEHPGPFAVNRAEVHASGVSAEYQVGLLHEADERIACMRESDPIADSGAAEFFPFFQRVQQSAARCEVIGEFRDDGNQFS